MKNLLALIFLAHYLGFSQIPADKGVITGQIRGTDGAPAAGVRVSAMVVPEPNVPPSGTVLESIGQTDNSGAFRLENVSPGRYYVLAGLVDFPTYFPGTIDRSAARIVTVTARGTATNVDFSLARPTRIKVSGRITGASLDPQKALQPRIVLLPRAAGSGILTTQLNADGTFEFPNVVPGTYSVQVVLGTVMPRQPLVITVADRDLTGVEIALQDSSSGTRREGMEIAWSQTGTRGGVASDSRTGLIYAASAVPGQMMELDSTGKVLRQFSITATGRPLNPSIIRLAHFAGNDQLVLLCFGIWNQIVAAYDISGNPLWTYPDVSSTPSSGIDDVAAADLDGDNSDEVIIGFNGGTGLHVLNSKGEVLWRSTAIGNVWHVSGGDVFGKGKAQVVTTSARGLVHVFSSDGSDRKDLTPGFYANMVRTVKIPETAAAATVLALGNANDSLRTEALSGDGTARWSLDLKSGAQPFTNSAWPAQSKPWLAVSLRGGEVYVIDAARGAIIGTIDGQGPTAEVGWSGNEANGSPLLLVAGPDKLTAYRIQETKK